MAQLRHLWLVLERKGESEEWYPHSLCLSTLGLHAEVGHVTYETVVGRRIETIFILQGFTLITPFRTHLLIVIMPVK